jgi:hypothetical protein
VSNRSDERDNEVIAGVRKALAQPEPGDRGAILLDGWMESEAMLCGWWDEENRQVTLHQILVHVATRDAVIGNGPDPADASTPRSSSACPSAIRCVAAAFKASTSASS